MGRLSPRRQLPGPRSRPRRSASRRAGVTVVPWDPGIERTTLGVRATGGALGASFVAALGLAAVDLAQSPTGWVVVAAAGAVGTVPALVVHVARRGARARQLRVGGLNPEQTRLVTEAAAQGDRLRALADAAPPGPVADHLDHLATTAERYVIALHQALSHARPDRPLDPEVVDEVGRMVAQLTELTEAAVELRQAQRRLLEPTPLEVLTDETRRLAAVIAAETSDPTHPSAY